MSLCVLVSVSAYVSVALGQDYSLGSDVPDSNCNDETLEKESEEDTMEYMDNLKEKLDASITPLSDMNSLDFSGETTEDRPEVTTEIDPYEYIHRKRLTTPTTSTVTTSTKKVPPKKRGRVGRPRKPTVFPMTQDQAQGPKKRMKWDNNMNKFIMYTYYYVTKLETDRKEYRRRMRHKFLEAYPEWTTITDQRLADQKRSIRQNRLLDIDTLREIKRAVKKELEEQGVVVEVPAEDSRDKSFYD